MTDRLIDKHSSSKSFAGKDGSSTSPTYSFDSDRNTGMFSGGQNILSFTTAGTARTSISATGVTSSVPFVGPSFTFKDDTNTGIISNNKDTVSVVTGGTECFTCSSDGSYPKVTFHNDDAPTAVGTVPNRIQLSSGSGFSVVSDAQVHHSTGSHDFYSGSTKIASLGPSSVDSFCDVKPSVNNTHSLGSPTKRWSSVYLVGAPNALSDARYKINVTTLSSTLGLEFIDSLRPVTYNWDEQYSGGDTGTHFGFIAQEIEDVFENLEIPLTGQDLIYNPYVFGDAGSESDEWSMFPTSICPPLVKAVQELSALATTQAATIATLQSTITALDARITALENP